MASTTFVDGSTLTAAAWFNDVDAVTYDGATTQILVGGGAGSVAVWTNATGTGAPARAGSPTFTGTVSAAALTVTGTFTLSGTAANIATGSNYISNGGTDAGLSFDGSNNATFSAGVTGAAGSFTTLEASGASTLTGGFTAGATSYVLASVAGALGLTVNNTSNDSSAETQIFIYNQNGGGDAFIRWFAGSNWYAGVDNSDSDSWSVGPAAIGTTPSIKITTAGAVTIPGTLTTNGGLQTFGANDSGGSGYRMVVVPNA